MIGANRWCNLQHGYQGTHTFPAELENYVAGKMLEVEFWGSGAPVPNRPIDDVYIGSAFVDLSPLVFSGRTLVSDIYPLLRPRTASLNNGRTRIRVLCHAVLGSGKVSSLTQPLIADLAAPRSLVVSGSRAGGIIPGPITNQRSLNHVLPTSHRR